MDYNKRRSRLWLLVAVCGQALAGPTLACIEEESIEMRQLSLCINQAIIEAREKTAHLDSDLLATLGEQYKAGNPLYDGGPKMAFDIAKTKYGCPFVDWIVPVNLIRPQPGRVGQ